MIVTTSRKPSSKVRSFCKHISGFIGCEYISRGKTNISMLADEFFLMRVGEYRGNPGIFDFFLNNEFVFSVQFNVSLDKPIQKGSKPIIKGNNPIAYDFSKLTGFEIGGNSKRVINISENFIEFMDNGEPYIILKILKVSFP